MTLRQAGPPPGTGARVLGLGAGLPTLQLDADRLGERVGRSGDWVRQRTGITGLRQLGPEQSLVGLSIDAARLALDAAGLDASRVGMVVAATCTAPTPLSQSVASAVAPGAAFLDVNAVCSGFCYALSVADGMIRTGSSEFVLLVASDEMSAVIDPADIGTSILFGDGATAMVLGAAPPGELHVGPVVWGSDGSQRALIEIPAGGKYMFMAGREVFRWAVESMADVALRACKEADLTIADVEVFVPHQANMRIVSALATRLGLGDSVVVADDVRISGNTSAASIPLAIAHLLADGRARSGQLALTIGFGAGLSWAAQIVRLP